MSLMSDIRYSPPSRSYRKLYQLRKWKRESEGGTSRRRRFASKDASVACQYGLGIG